MLSSLISFRERADSLVQATLAPGARSHISARAVDLLLPYLLHGPIADIGCGFASPLNEAAFHTVGIDINPARALAHANPQTEFPSYFRRLCRFLNENRQMLLPQAASVIR